MTPAEALEHIAVALLTDAQEQDVEALAVLTAAVTWRPIAEAPRDGTEVLVSWPIGDGTERNYAIAEWCAFDDEWKESWSRDFLDPDLWLPITPPEGA
jgi:hypothetical protein